MRPWIWRTALTRIGEVRSDVYLGPMTEATVEDIILAAPHLWLLVRGVIKHRGLLSAPIKRERIFWDAIGRLLRRDLGEDRLAWQTAAASLHCSLLRTRNYSSAGEYPRLMRRSPG